MISCGGGKDSTALLQLVHSVDPSVPVVCADPPNPLPDRPGHLRLLEMADGGGWHHVSYWWDVDAVLAGEKPYPEGLKIRRLEAFLAENGFDGLALGLRAQESRGRAYNYARRGSLYLHGSGRWVVTPLAQWTAEEVIGYVAAADILPTNPVYRKLELAPDLNRLRDGTWYPRETADAQGYEDWLRLHYPEVANLYRRALLLPPLPRNRFA